MTRRFSRILVIGSRETSSASENAVGNQKGLNHESDKGKTARTARRQSVPFSRIYNVCHVSFMLFWNEHGINFFLEKGHDKTRGFVLRLKHPLCG